ncbi:unnamed protein product, partial [Prorocentrum cordatum]
APDCLLASPPHRVLGAPASVDHQAPAMLAAALRRAAARAAAPAAQAAAKPAENPMALARTAPPSTSWSARPPAQSTIGSSTSTLSQWCSWSTQAPPCWTSEGTGLVILFLSLSISLSDFSPSSGLAVCFRRGARDCHGAKGSFRKQSFSTTQLLRGHVLQAYRF